jgi:hypothetical protein
MVWGSFLVMSLVSAAKLLPLKAMAIQIDRVLLCLRFIVFLLDIDHTVREIKLKGMNVHRGNIKAANVHGINRCGER